MEWDYSGTKGRDGQKKIDEANKKRKRGKQKRVKDEVNGQGGKRMGRGALAPSGVSTEHQMPNKPHSKSTNLDCEFTGKDCYHPYPPSPFIIITQLES